MLEKLDPPPDGLIVASPCNPAGTMLHPDELAAIAAWCDAAGVRLISDEIYHGLNYDSAITTAAALSPHAIVVNSFSKYFAMTGWRIGWLILPEDLVRPVERLAQNLFISAPHISQVAAEAAFDCHDELQANVARYRRSRDHLLRALPDAGFTRLSPAEGAFYLFADIADRSNDSAAFCARMLAEVGIAVTPGVDFDHARGGRFLRFSYCGPEGDMAGRATAVAWRSQQIGIQSPPTGCSRPGLGTRSRVNEHRDAQLQPREPRRHYVHSCSAARAAEDWSPGSGSDAESIAQCSRCAFAMPSCSEVAASRRHSAIHGSVPGDQWSAPTLRRIAAATHCAQASACRSSPIRVTIWMPSGRPSGPVPAGTVTQGTCRRSRSG